MESQGIGKSQIAIFDELAAVLPAEQREKEKTARIELIDAAGQFKISRFDLGKALNAYKALCKEQKRLVGGQRWFDRVLEALSIERSTGYRILANYRQVAKVPGPVRAEAEARRIDLAEQKHSRLVSQIQERSEQDSPDHDLPPADLLDKCIKALTLHRQTSAPTIQKATGPIPVPAKVKVPLDYAKRKAELFAEYRKAYVDQAEADRAIDAVIVAALEAQLSKLPKVKVAA